MLVGVVSSKPPELVARAMPQSRQRIDTEAGDSVDSVDDNENREENTEEDTQSSIEQHTGVDFRVSDATDLCC